jgi:hypothetical protein
MIKHRFQICLIASALGGALALFAPTAAWATLNLDPFATRAAKLPSPFHTAQAEEAPAESTASAGNKATTDEHPRVEPAAATAAAPLAPSTTTLSSTKSAAAPKGPACSRDDECPADTICENQMCQAFERSIDILLYRKAGRSTAILPFYWSDRSNPGYRVVAPFYFHFWSPQGHTQIVAPFYWRVEDRLKQRVVLVIPPYAQTREPGARSWAVWPFVYISTKFGWAAPPLLSFKVGDPDHGSAFGMWFLLYLWTRSPASKFDLLFPFAISTRSKDSAFTYAVPLNFYWRDKEDRNLLSIPFFYRNTTPTGGTFASVLGYGSVENQATMGSFLWLYWYGRSPSASHDVLFPILWSFRSPESNVTILPPLVHIRSGDTATGTFALLGWWSSDRKEGSNWQLALPFYFRQSGDHGATAFHLWPTGAYSRNDKAGSRRLTLLVPPLLYWRDKTDAVDYELLYYRHRDIPGNAQTTIVGPYYQREDPAGTTHTLFPLFWHFRDAATGATAHSLLPFYFRRNAPDEKLTAAGIFPLWAYYRSFSDGGSSGGLFPLAFFGSRKDKSHAIVFPLFWRFRNKDAISTLFFPLYYASSDRTSSNTAILPLLYFAGHDHDRSYRIQIPFFWNFADARDGTSTTLAPFCFRDKDSKGYAAGIPPLVYWGGGAQRHFAIFPLFWWFRDDERDRTTTVVANYLHRRHGHENTDAFFPLFHYRRGARPGGSDETSLTLFPFFHYRRDARSTVFASPVMAFMRRADKQAGFAGPCFWYRDTTMAARGIPLLWLDHTQLDTGERTRMWGPFVALDGPGHQSRILFPLWGKYRTAQEEGTYVFPTFFRWRKADGYQVDSFLPLLWLSRSPVSHTTAVGPYFSHHSPTNTSSGILPLYLSSRDAKRDVLVTPLFVSHTSHASQTRRIISWLYYQSKHGDETTLAIFPLWWQSHDENKSTAIGLPLFWHFADKRADKSMTLAGPLYWAHQGSERTRGLLPLAWYSRDGRKDSSSLAVMPLFYERHSPTSRTFLTLPFGYQRNPDSHWWYVGNLVWRDTWKSSFNTFFPLWFYHYDKFHDARTLVIPPLLHYSRISPERSLSAWFLLFWRRSDITSSTTVGLPLFYDLHSYHQSRLTMALPLFFRYQNETSGQAYTIAPLYFRRSGPVDSTTIAFPLLWRFWSEERSTTVVFPFYVGVRRDTYDATYVFPNIYYRSGRGAEAGTSHLFVFPFWESEIKRPGDYMWEALLGAVGWERIGRNRFLKLLFIPFELEAAPAAKTAWYGKPPTRARERMARGLDVKAW